MIYKSTFFPAKVVVILSFFILLQGCSSKFGPVDGQDKALSHVVQVGWDGNLYEIPEDKKEAINSSAGYRRMQQCAKGTTQACKDQKNAEQASFDAIINGIKEFTPASGGTKHVLLYLHGGLNTREAALKRVIKDTEAMQKDGNVYPVFINWRSGPMTTLKDHYFRIRNGKIENVAKFTSPVYMVGDVVKILGNAPMAWWQEGKLSISSILGQDNAEVDNDESRKIYLTEDKSAKNIGRSAQWLLTSPFKVVSTPIVFTLGEPAWDNMKRRVHTMFLQPTDFNGTVSPELATDCDLVSGSGATLKFIRYFNKFVKDNNENFPENSKIEVTLMGHSMGGIILNQILSYCSDMEVSNLVFMASADNLANYFKAVIPFVQKRKTAKKNMKDIQVYHLHLHPENEDREVTTYGLAPSGSLLAWIDHTYDSPEYILQRTMGRWDNLRKTLPLIPPEIQSHFHYKIFGRSEKTDVRGPQKHGEFDNVEFKYWQKKYWFKEDNS